MSSSNFCPLTCIQVSQEAGQVVWYSYLFENFPQFVVIHTVKGFGTVSKAEVAVFLELSCVFDDPTDVGDLVSGSSAFSTSGLNTDINMSHQMCGHCFISVLLRTLTSNIKDVLKVSCVLHTHRIH